MFSVKTSKPCNGKSSSGFHLHSSCYSDFFLLRTPITINGRPTVIKRVNGEPVLRDTRSVISVKLSTILQQAIAPVTRQHGVFSVDKHYHERVPLFVVNFQSKSCLKIFLDDCDKQAVQEELSLAIAGLFEHVAEERQQFQVSIEVKLFLISPTVGERQQPMVSEIKPKNYQIMLDQWKKRKLFTFTHDMFTNHTEWHQPSNENAELADLEVELTEVVDWLALGVQLKLPTYELLTIRKDHRYTKECRLEMLIRWDQLEKPTWRKLVPALVNIDRRDLAEKIAKKHGVPLPEAKVNNDKDSDSHSAWTGDRLFPTKSDLQKSICRQSDLEGQLKKATQSRDALSEQLTMLTEETIPQLKGKVSSLETELKNQKEHSSKIEEELAQTRRQLVDKEKELRKKIKEFDAASARVCKVENELEKARQIVINQQEEISQETFESMALEHSCAGYLLEIEIQRDIAEKEMDKQKENIQCYTRELTDKTERISQLSAKIREAVNKYEQLHSGLLKVGKLQLKRIDLQFEKHHVELKLERSKKIVKKCEAKLAKAGAKQGPRLSSQVVDSVQSSKVSGKFAKLLVSQGPVAITCLPSEQTTSSTSAGVHNLFTRDSQTKSSFHSIGKATSESVSDSQPVALLQPKQIDELPKQIKSSCHSKNKPTSVTDSQPVALLQPKQIDQPPKQIKSSKNYSFKNKASKMTDFPTISLSWRIAQHAPAKIARWTDAAVDGDIAYFRYFQYIYMYNSTSNTWCQPFKPSSSSGNHSAIAVINGSLTTVGGVQKNGENVNQLFSLVQCGRNIWRWKEKLPCMPNGLEMGHTKVAWSHDGKLIVAAKYTSTILILSVERHLWFEVCNQPVQPCLMNTNSWLHSLVACGEHLYLIHVDNRMFRCLTRDLFESTLKSNQKGIWTELKHKGCPSYSTFVSCGGRLMSVGGKIDDRPSSAIKLYSPTTKAWNETGHMKTPRWYCFAAVIPNNRLLVAGGHTTGETSDCTDEVEIGTIQFST